MCNSLAEDIILLWCLLCPGKATSEDIKDTEVISVEVSDIVSDTSQAYNSSCTGSAPNL